MGRLRNILSGRRGLAGLAAVAAVTGFAMPAVMFASAVTGSDATVPAQADTTAGSSDAIPAGQAVPSVSAWRILARRAASSGGGFMTPTGIAMDRRGVALVTLADDDRVWVIANDGSPATPWDVTGAGTLFRRPGSVALTPSGTVLVADTGNHRIVHLSSVVSPRVLAVIGGTTSGTGKGMFIRPSDAVADEAGRIIVSDTGNHRIQLFDRDGRFLAVWGRTVRGAPKSGGGVGEFASPRGVGVGRDGRIVVADTGNNRIQSHARVAVGLESSGGWDVWPAPAIHNPLRGGDYRMPTGIAVDQTGRTLIADSGNHRIVVRNADARTWDFWGGPSGTAPGEFVMPMSVTVGADGDVAVADTGNDRIQVATLRPATSA